MENRSEEILIRLTTEQLSTEERSYLLAQISNDEEAMETYRLIESTDQWAGVDLLEAPSANFTARVVSSYERSLLRRKNNRLLWIFSLVSVGLLLAIIALVGTNGTGTEVLNLRSLNSPELKHYSDSIFQLGMQVFTNTQIVLGIVIANALMALMVIDSWLRKHVLKLGV